MSDFFFFWLYMLVQFVWSLHFGWWAFLLGLLCQWGLIQLLRRRQIFQKIYQLSPSRHQAKMKTPSFGGVGIMVSFLLSLLIISYWEPLWTPVHIWLTVGMVLFFLIGFYDDIVSLMKQTNKGLTARSKFLLQIAASMGLVYWFSTAIRPLSLVEMAFYVFLMVGFSNATNITDGLDGLLGSLFVFTIFALSFLMGYDSVFSPVWPLLLMYQLMAFLVFNWHPAKIFMGDSGSLALGFVLVGISLIYDKPWLAFGLGGVYVIETASVIIQVAWFKLTRRRVFLMAPLHHHFELLGLKERTIVVLFWFLGFIFFLLSLYL